MGVPVAAVFLPAALLFVAFMFIPLAALFWRAFDSGELGDSITSALVVDAMRLSAITSTVSLVITLLFGTPLAYILARREFPGKVLIDLLVDLPIVLPPTVAGVALLVAFGRRGVLGAAGRFTRASTWRSQPQPSWLPRPSFLRPTTSVL